MGPLNLYRLHQCQAQWFEGVLEKKGCNKVTKEERNNVLPFAAFEVTTNKENSTAFQAKSKRWLLI